MSLSEQCLREAGVEGWVRIRRDFVKRVRVRKEAALSGQSWVYAERPPESAARKVLADGHPKAGCTNLIRPIRVPPGTSAPPRLP